MNRRRFVHNSLFGITGLPASGASLRSFGKKLVSGVDHPRSPGSELKQLRKDLNSRFAMDS